MYDIIFYQDRSGNSEILNYLNGMAKKAETSKTDRINHTKILTYLNVLAQ